MTTHTDPERSRAYLDDLARLSVRHGLRIRRHGGGEIFIEPTPENFGGTSACICGGEATLAIETKRAVRGLDPIRLSAAGLGAHVGRALATAQGGHDGRGRPGGAGQARAGRRDLSLRPTPRLVARPDGSVHRPRTLPAAGASDR